MHNIIGYFIILKKYVKARLYLQIKKYLLFMPYNFDIITKNRRAYYIAYKCHNY